MGGHNEMNLRKFAKQPSHTLLQKLWVALAEKRQGKLEPSLISF